MSYSLDFTSRLRLARFAKNLNQRQLAARLGVTPSAVAHWEIGTAVPNANNKIKLNTYFGYDICANIMTKREKNGERNTDI